MVHQNGNQNGLQGSDRKRELWTWFETGNVVFSSCNLTSVKHQELNVEFTDESAKDQRLNVKVTKTKLKRHSGKCITNSFGSSRSDGNA